jgi:hypothetical protein
MCLSLRLATLTRCSACVQGLLEDTDFLSDVVNAHRNAIDQMTRHLNHVQPLPELPDMGLESSSALATSFTDLGTQLLEACGGFSGADISRACLGGCFMKVLDSISQLTPRSPSSSTADVSKPCLEEMTLAVAPIQSLLFNIQQLLERFPEQPMLEKLHMICQRILGARLCMQPAWFDVELH